MLKNITKDKTARSTNSAMPSAALITNVLTERSPDLITSLSVGPFIEWHSLLRSISFFAIFDPFLLCSRQPQGTCPDEECLPEPGNKLFTYSLLHQSLTRQFSVV
eukprot:Gb_14271 [translate_table: standard]